MTLGLAPLSGLVSVVILGAGQGQRMCGVDKIFTPLKGIPLIAHSLRTFASMSNVHKIALVLSEGRLSEGTTLADRYGAGKVVRVCKGGARRQDSVRAGLDGLDHCDWVIVHDGARPIVDPPTIVRGMEAAMDTGAAVCAVPAKDTIKLVSNDGLVRETPPRERLWQVQTPQVFRYSLIMEAHDKCEGTFTDDASMVESLGVAIKVFMGSYRNIKVTTPEDLLLAEALIKSRATEGVFV